MQLRLLSVLVLQAASAVLGEGSSNATDARRQIAALAEKAYKRVETSFTNRTDSGRHASCTWDNVQVRKEWGTLSKSERKSYVAAVQCLQSSPPRTPESLSNGTKSRFDDFVATHINQTLTIHFTGNFLTWHRYFTWLYEQALVEECGYNGTQPYFDWPLVLETGMESSTVFDGSETSIGGNGKVANESEIIIEGSGDLPSIYLPHGSGGGCVQSGPFSNFSVNLGPAALHLADGAGGLIAATNPLDYNPRCLKRDLSDAVLQEFCNATAVLANIVDMHTIYDFENQMQGWPGTTSLGIHGGGHYSWGGDPARDVYVSPGDPVFYLHHSMIDRVWWIWQMLGDGEERVWGDQAINGTNTFLNDPVSNATTLDDYVNYGYAAGPPEKIRNLMSTTAGPFCYVYQ